MDRVPSISTIWRILRREGLIEPQPQKRPRSSLIRFEADLPNEMWQADITHWALAGGEGVEILNVIDDHSRLFLASVARPIFKAADVADAFRSAVDLHGAPASLLCDNGAVFTAAPRGGKVLLQVEMERLGVIAKNSRPYHPQTCGKVERWHRTLKGFLAKRPATTLGELQLILEEVVRYYNDVRPHRGINRRTPSVAYNARAKAKAHTLIHQPHWRIRTDTVDVRGHVTLRYLGKLRHLNVGWSYRGQSIRLYILDDVVTFANDDGEFIGETRIDPNRDYQPKGEGFR